MAMEKAANLLSISLKRLIMREILWILENFIIIRKSW